MRLMNTRPEIDLDLDLQFLPAWAREPADANRFAGFEGEAAEEKRGPRERALRRGGARMVARQQRRDRSEQVKAQVTPSSEVRRPRGKPERRTRQEKQRQQQELPLPQVEVEFIPDERGVESLVKQIKLRGRAYPLFEIAKLILKVPDRYQIRFVVKRDKEGKPLQPLVVCSLDESLWLSEDEVVDHIMRRHFATFYKAEKVPVDPPKGTYTFVAKCGLSGVILGPPNYHDYQTKLHRLHAERFSHIPFEVYKSKIKIVRDEAAVKQWLEEQSYRVEYLCLNVPDVIKLSSREEVEQHFRSVHLPNLVREVEDFVLSPGNKRPPMSRSLQLLLKHTVEEQKRFPLKVATKLSQQFAAQGLQFFKVSRVVHVSVARPHYLDLQNTVVSDNVRRIIEYIKANPNCTRRQLIEALAPTPVSSQAQPYPGEPSQTAAQLPEQTTQTQQAAPNEQIADSKSPQTEPPEPTPEQTAIIADLHWLIHQGHIIEFYDGHIELAKPPKPKPQPAAEVPATDSGQLEQAGSQQIQQASQQQEAEQQALVDNEAVPELKEAQDTVSDRDSRETSASQAASLDSSAQSARVTDAAGSPSEESSLGAKPSEPVNPPVSPVQEIPHRTEAAESQTEKQQPVANE